MISQGRRSAFWQRCGLAFIKWTRTKSLAKMFGFSDIQDCCCVWSGQGMCVWETYGDRAVAFKDFSVVITNPRRLIHPHNDLFGFFTASTTCPRRTRMLCLRSSATTYRVTCRRGERSRQIFKNIMKYFRLVRCVLQACRTRVAQCHCTRSTRSPPWTERETRSRMFKGGTLRFVSVNLRAATTLMLKSCRDLPKRLLEFLFKRSTSRVKVFYPKTKSEETRARLF